MQRHQRHRVGVGAERVDVGDERRALEEMVERTQADFAQLVGDRLRGAGDQLAHVVETLRRFGTFGAQIVAVANRIDELAQQFVDRRFLRALAQSQRSSRTNSASATRAAGRSVAMIVREARAFEHRQPARARRLGEHARSSFRRDRASGTPTARRNASSSAGFAISLRYAMRSRISRRS